MNGSGPYNVRKPSPDDVAHAIEDRVLTTARMLRNEAQAMELAVAKERRENAWAADHVRALADWQRDALYRLLQRMNEED